MVTTLKVEPTQRFCLRFPEGEFLAYNQDMFVPERTINPNKILWCITAAGAQNLVLRWPRFMLSIYSCTFNMEPVLVVDTTAIESLDP